MIIKLADIRIAVNNIYPYIEKYCADYICYDRRRADFTVDISDEDIARERAAVERTVAAEGHSGIEFGDPYLETLAVYRKIAERMPSYDTVLFHGSRSPLTAMDISLPQRAERENRPTRGFGVSGSATALL